MRVKFIKYGRHVRGPDGTSTHAEVSLELQHGDFEEEAFAKARQIINRELHDDSAPLRATIGDRMKSGRPGYMGDVNGPGSDPDVP